MYTTDLEVTYLVYTVLDGLLVVDYVLQVYDFQGYVLVVGFQQHSVHRAERAFAEYPVEHDPSAAIVRRSVAAVHDSANGGGGKTRV